MWPFKRKKSKPVERTPDLICVHCGSKDVRIVSDALSDSLAEIKVWRGIRYLTCECQSCHHVFYTDELPEVKLSNRLIEDEDQLRTAEEELKKKTDEEGDRRYGMSG